MGDILGPDGKPLGGAVVVIGPDGKPDTTREKLELILNLKSANLELGRQVINLWTALTQVIASQHDGEYTWSVADLEKYQSEFAWGAFEQMGDTVTFRTPTPAQVKKRKKEANVAN